MKKLEKRIIHNGNYDIAYYPCNKFSSMDIIVNFQMQANKEKYFNIKMLVNYMTTITKKYNSIEVFNRKVKELYNIGFVPFICTIGNKIIVSIKINLINPRYLNDDYFKDAMDFVKEIFYNPYFIDKMPEKDIFSHKLKERKENYKSNLTSPDYKAYYQFTKNWGADSHDCDDFFGSKKEIDEIFKNSSQKMYDLYNELFNNFVSMEILGDFEEEELSLIKSTFKFNKVNKIDTNYFVPYKYEKYDKSTKDKNVSESIYFELFRINDYDIKDRSLYILIERFLNYSVGRLLHTKLRDELGIVYNSYASFNQEYGFLMFVSNINRKNKNKCRKGIEDTINMLKDEELINRLLKEAIEQEEEKEYLSDEDYYEHLSYISTETIRISISRREFLEYIKKVKYKDILWAVNNLERRSTYIYEGTKE